MTARKTPQTPQPVPVTTICSMCGLGWELHGKTPTTEDCIRLLKIELAKRPNTITIPYVQPYVYPVYPRTYPWYGNTYEITCSNTAQGAQGNTQYVSAQTCSPQASSVSPSPVAA